MIYLLDMVFFFFFSIVFWCFLYVYQRAKLHFSVWTLHPARNPWTPRAPRRPWQQRLRQRFQRRRPCRRRHCRLRRRYRKLRRNRRRRGWAGLGRALVGLNFCLIPIKQSVFLGWDRGVFHSSYILGKWCEVVWVTSPKWPNYIHRWITIINPSRVDGSIPKNVQLVPLFGPLPI